MKNFLYAILISTLSITGCANSVSVPSRGSVVQSQQGADPIEVEESFVTVSTAICGRYFENDLNVAALAKAAGVELAKLPAGARYPGGVVTGTPVYRAGDGIVHIRENLLGASCEVYAYGIPVEPSFERIASGLLAVGFAEDEQRETEKLVFIRGFSKEMNDAAISAMLSGNEPGAPGTLSRFSTLTARFTFGG